MFLDALASLGSMLESQSVGPSFMFLRLCQILGISAQCAQQGCISCGILVSGIGARGVSSEHMENMEMFSCSPT